MDKCVVKLPVKNFLLKLELLHNEILSKDGAAIAEALDLLDDNRGEGRDLDVVLPVGLWSALDIREISPVHAGLLRNTCTKGQSTSSRNGN